MRSSGCGSWSSWSPGGRRITSRCGCGCGGGWGGRAPGRGRLEVPALGTALRTVVARHEVLRTRLVADGEGAAQVMEAPWDPLRVSDLTGLGPAAQAQAV